MRGVEVKHIRRRDVDLEKIWDAAEGATAGRGVIYVGRSKNETSKRLIPLNSEARSAVERMLKRADDLGHTDPAHYLWCASQHHKFEPTKPAKKRDGAWHSLRDAAGCAGGIDAIEALLGLVRELTGRPETLQNPDVTA
jgi:integrase